MNLFKNHGVTFWKDQLDESMHLLKAVSLSQKLVTEIRLPLSRASLTGVAFTLEVSVRNNAAFPAKLSWPGILIHYRGMLLMESAKRKETLSIGAKSEKQIACLSVGLGLPTLLSEFPDMITEIYHTGKVTLTVETCSKIGGWYSYRDKQDLFLKG